MTDSATPGTGSASWYSRHGEKIWVSAIIFLLLAYMALTVHRAWLLLQDPQPVAIALGAALLVLPVIGAWALIREILFGSRMSKLAKILEAEGGLPVDNLPRTPGGRIVREAADAEFEMYKVEAEAAPEDWRSWFRLSCAYDAARDRKRARESMRKAIELSRG
ncbi:tetratricopeptide repeat protein [Arthrobacter sp. VKM Ac-2550]|uniref:tetratricopeptide repeat protein n=1 Tax=Crystallibacter permensis TaxID=1938888 RepID=UPI0022273C70|nr:tetratricopeptide repeat protein [Arthrobacter sp. VKM Ac-2550]